ncbi:hypothetical protein DAPPUDRAFT_119549 [Daphnia pulex]|uniref:Uncharacterized protein n=1 Tax=Daphnia pulex TaxID=6669 RepID=E9HYU8_DAPPU|nr:hypothetical protein DAPPUDRAFT_119549 [Daphnia pulex]|eukprot:EFX63083.1 hypothetical protein DAPPUDRAFT_119549 [Daphnia pulex]
MHPNLDVSKIEETSDSERLMLLTIEQLIDLLEALGATCVFCGDYQVRRYGLACWYEATKLREGHAIPKTPLPQSEWEKLAMRNKVEFSSVKHLEKLLGMRRTHWIVQAIIVGGRLLKKFNRFPNKFLVFNVSNFAFRIWRGPGTKGSRCFALCLYILELIGTTEFSRDLVLHPVEAQDVLHLTYTELFNVFDLLNISEPDTVLTFARLMETLDFCFSYNVKLHDLSPEDAIQIDDQWTIQSKADKIEDVQQLIIVILKLLVSIPKSKTQSKELKSRIAIYINIYELKRANKKPNLLLKVCSSHQGDPNEFKLIKLLLKAGADPNAVDQQRCSPLHLLADGEVESSHMWGDASYSTRAENFAEIVRIILDGRFHEDQVNLRGQSALECLKPFSSLYPNAQLCLLVGNFLQQLQGVRSLSCIAAKVVRKHQLPCECLPVTLQSMVLQH